MHFTERIHWNFTRNQPLKTRR